MSYLSPICFTSDGTFIYAAAFGYDATRLYIDAFDADLIIARSNPYPESLRNTNWTVISTSRSYPSEAIEATNFVYTYNCAWNPQTSGFGLLAQALPGFTPGSVSRFSVYIPEHGLSVLSTSSETVSPRQQVLRGRNILLPVESDNNEARSWLQVCMDHSVNQMSFSYLGKYLEIAEQPQVQWPMDAIKTGISRKHSLNLTNNSISYNLSDTLSFYTDRAYVPKPYGTPPSYLDESGISTKKIIAITFAILCAFCVTFFVVRLLSVRKRKSPPERSEEHELEASSPVPVLMYDVDGSYPSIYPSNTNDELPSYAAATAPGSGSRRD
ncbi:hypothetical protein BGX26_009171 [Mortierella sp. AD094]|nr:hypothetical protein BGX26_009171 [Mortierella sp. AD094]